MISRSTSSVPKDDVFPTKLYSDSMSSQACCCPQGLRSVLQDLSPVLSGLSPPIKGTPRHMVGTPRRSQACGLCSQVPPELSSPLPSALRYIRMQLHWSSKLWYLMTLGFWSAYSHTHPEARRDQNTFW